MRDTPWIPPTEQIRVEKILTRETEYLPVPETNETERTRPRAATDAVAWTLPAPSHAPKRGPTVVSCRVVSCRVVLCCVEIYVAIVDGKFGDVEKLCGQCIQLALHRWASLPPARAGDGAHRALLQACH